MYGTDTLREVFLGARGKLSNGYYRDVYDLVAKTAIAYGFLKAKKTRATKVKYEREIVDDILPGAYGPKYAPPVPCAIVKSWKIPRSKKLPHTLLVAKELIQQYNLELLKYNPDACPISPYGRKCDVLERVGFIFGLISRSFGNILINQIYKAFPAQQHSSTVPQSLPPALHRFDTSPLPELMLETRVELLRNLQQPIAQPRSAIDLSDPEHKAKRQKLIDVEDDPIYNVPLYTIVDFLEHVNEDLEVPPSDDDVEVISETRSYNCPIGMNKISIPVRGKDCRHVRCFDLFNFLAFAKQQKHWSCPQCKKDAHPPENLVLVTQDVVSAMPID